MDDTEEEKKSNLVPKLNVGEFWSLVENWVELSMNSKWDGTILIRIHYKLMARGKKTPKNE